VTLGVQPSKKIKLLYIAHSISSRVADLMTLREFETQMINDTWIIDEGNMPQQISSWIVLEEDEMRAVVVWIRVLHASLERQDFLPTASSVLSHIDIFSHSLFLVEFQ
jgi:hypothetical protein